MALKFKLSGNHGSSHNSNTNRENRLLATHNHGGHDHQHHQHHNEIIERIDEVIELVDCGGRDLGFCDMSSKYPGSVFQANNFLPLTTNSIFRATGNISIQF